MALWARTGLWSHIIQSPLLVLCLELTQITRGMCWTSPGQRAWDTRHVWQLCGASSGPPPHVWSSQCRIHNTHCRHSRVGSAVLELQSIGYGICRGFGGREGRGVHRSDPAPCCSLGQWSGSHHSSGSWNPMRLTPLPWKNSAPSILKLGVGRNEHCVPFPKNNYHIKKK